MGMVSRAPVFVGFSNVGLSCFLQHIAQRFEIFKGHKWSGVPFGRSYVLIGANDAPSPELSHGHGLKGACSHGVGFFKSWDFPDISSSSACAMGFWRVQRLVNVRRPLQFPETQYHENAAVLKLFFVQTKW